MTPPTKFFHVTQIILYMCLCDQSLVTLNFNFIRIFSEKKNIFLRASLASGSIIWDWHWVWYSNFTPCAISIKLKVKVLGANHNRLFLFEK